VRKRTGIPSRNLQFLLAAIQYLRFLKNILTKLNNKHYSNLNTKRSKITINKLAFKINKTIIVAAASTFFSPSLPEFFLPFLLANRLVVLNAKKKKEGS